MWPLIIASNLLDWIGLYWVSKNGPMSNSDLGTFRFGNVKKKSALYCPANLYDIFGLIWGGGASRPPWPCLRLWTVVTTANVIYATFHEKTNPLIQAADIARNRARGCAVRFGVKTTGQINSFIHLFTQQVTCLNNTLKHTASWVGQQGVKATIHVACT